MGNINESTILKIIDLFVSFPESLMIYRRIQDICHGLIRFQRAFCMVLYPWVACIRVAYNPVAYNQVTYILVAYNRCRICISKPKVECKKKEVKYRDFRMVFKTKLRYHFIVSNFLRKTISTQLKRFNKEIYDIVLQTCVFCLLLYPNTNNTRI